MLKRPKTLYYFGFLMVLIAASFPVQIMFLYGHSPLEWDSILLKISALNWMVIALTLATGAAVLRAAPSVRFLVPGTIFMVSLNNWVVGSLETDFSPLAAALGTFSFVAVHLPLCQRKLIDLIKHPEKRWWLTPKRLQKEIAAFVSPLNGIAFKAKTYNLSETGAFIPIDENIVEITQPLTRIKGAPKETKLNKRTPKPLNINDRVTICLNLGNFRQLRCDARVVRKTEAQGTYPEGLGIKFENLNRSERRDLKRFLEASA